MTLLRGKRGPDPTEIDWESVKGLCAIQCTKDEICSFLGIHHDTLMRACNREYECTFKELRGVWAGGGRCSLRRKQWKLADKSPAMAIFLGKQMLGQRDDVRLNHSGVINQEIVHYGDGAPKKYSDEVSEAEDEDFEV